MDLLTKSEQKAQLLGSLLLFTKIFFKIRTGKEFHIEEPHGREPRHLSISRELTKVFNGDIQDLFINIQPGSHKSTLLTHFIAWCYAHYPDCNFLYISHTESLAQKHTNNIRQIIQLYEYKEMFNVELRKDSSAKGHFITTSGGSVMAFGSKGPITGQDAGLPNLDRFSGAVIIDDIHKPSEIHSELSRNKVITNYQETIESRKRGPTIPTIAIGQTLHESDFFGYLKSGKDGKKWNSLILKTVDDAGNNLCPDVITSEQLEISKNLKPYVYASQYQQCPQPAGGGIFKEEWFPLLDLSPEIISTFITVDSAETSKTHNDATVFSLFGLYKIIQHGVESEIYGLHWIDCRELWVEPKDLHGSFIQFYRESCRYDVKPNIVAIEKKSTGTTLVSIMKDFQGLHVIEIERNSSSGSKTDRFLNIQPYVAEKRVSLPSYGKHTRLCIKHMSKITANNTHRYDDIADTLADGVQLGLIDKILYVNNNYQSKTDDIVKKMAAYNQRYLPQSRDSWRGY